MAGELAQPYPESWQVCRLDEVAMVIDSLHKTPAYSESGRPMVRVTDVRGGFLDVSKALLVTEDVFQEFTRRYAPKQGDIVFSRVGSYGNASYANTDTPFCLGQNTALISPRIDGRFLHLFLQSAEARRQIEQMVVGSTQKTISLKSISSLRVPIPPAAELEAIAHILGTLDDKIELSRRMNETLGAMARALFKSWFVDFEPVRAKAEGRGLPKHLAQLFPDSFEDSVLGEIPKGWGVSVLDELADVILGGDWGGDEQDTERSEAALCIRGADIPDLQIGGTGKMPVRFLKPSSLAKRRLNDGDLVVEISGGSPTQSTGRPVLVTRQLLERIDLPLVCSNFCRLLKLRSPAYSKFVYLWLRSLYANDEFLQFENGTTGIKNLAFTLFSSSFKLCIPQPEILEAFDLRVAPIFNKQQTNAAEAGTLSALRDTLLPKLISGDLRVRDAERFLKDRGL